MQYPSLSTDQIGAFVALATHGSLRAAAETLHITEQGVRNRLITLEQRLGVELYRKSRGMRRTTPLTPDGRKFLPHALEFLRQSVSLCELFDSTEPVREINIIASQYLIAYVLIDGVRRFHKQHANIQVRLSARTEHEIEQALLEHPDFALGVAAPYESSPHLEYIHLFSMNWSLITPARHPLLDAKTLRLKDLVDQPLILYERGSTGRQHVFDAFQRQSLSPHVEMETTNTDLIVRMVEAGLGISIVPLLSSGAITKGRRVGVRNLGRQIRPIDSGILFRKGETLSEPCRRFIEFVKAELR